MKRPKYLGGGKNLHELTPFSVLFQSGDFCKFVPTPILILQRNGL